MSYGDMRKVQIEEARKRLGELVDRARFAGEPTLIMRYHTPAAVLVPASWYEDQDEEWVPEDGFQVFDVGTGAEYRSSDESQLGPAIAELYHSSGAPELEAGSDT